MQKHFGKWELLLKVTIGCKKTLESWHCQKTIMQSHYLGSVLFFWNFCLFYSKFFPVSVTLFTNFYPVIFSHSTTLYIHILQFTPVHSLPFTKGCKLAAKSLYFYQDILTRESFPMCLTLVTHSFLLIIMSLAVRSHCVQACTCN